MTWRDQLRPASFRGVPFFVRDHETSGGRRGELHQFPARDEPYGEDLGAKARQYRVEAYVLGEDYMAARDALLVALETPGPGALVHPYLGTLQVTVIGAGYSLRETKDEGGKASFAITFVQAGENRFPQASIDTRGVTRARVDTSIAAVEEAFAESFDVGKKPAFIQEAAAGLLIQAGDELDALARRLTALPEAAPAFARDLARLRAGANALVLAPATLASRVTGLVASLASLGSDPLPALRALGELSFFGAALAPVPSGTANRSVQAANRLALTGLVRRAATIEAARSSADLDFESRGAAPALGGGPATIEAALASANLDIGSRDAALALRDDLAGGLEREILAAGDEVGAVGGAPGSDTVLAALKDLLAAVVRDLTARGAALPGLVTILPGATLPAFVLAHEFAGDDPSAVLAQAEDMVARNRVRHPGFVPGGREIEALHP